MRCAFLALTLLADSLLVAAQPSSPEGSNRASQLTQDEASDVDPEAEPDAEVPSPGLRALRAAVEQTVILALGTAWYWLDKKHNVADWDFDSWRERLSGEAFRYDNNAFAINWVFHPASGSAMYGLPRANGMSVPAAYAYAFLTSFTWEWMLEFRERFSINDQIATPTAGMALGEFLVKVARYLNSMPRPSLGRRVLAWTAGLPAAMHRAMDGRPAPTGPTDRFGYALPLWRRFLLSAGPRHVQRGASGAWLGELRFAGELVELRRFLEPGRRRRRFGDANVTRLRARATRGAEGGGFEMYADTTFAGFAREAITERQGRRFGHAVVVGSNVAFFYRRQSFGVWSDRLGVVGLPGLALDVHILRDELRLTARGRLNADFAGVHAATFQQWARRRRPDEVAKSILVKQGYYYGWGLSARLEAELVGRWIEAGARWMLGRWWSHEGLDRNQAAVTADLALSDRRVDLEGWLRLRPGRHGLFFEIALARTWRRAALETLPTERDALNSYHLSVGILR